MRILKYISMEWVLWETKLPSNGAISYSLNNFIEDITSTLENPHVDIYGMIYYGIELPYNELHVGGAFTLRKRCLNSFAALHITTLKKLIT